MVMDLIGIGLIVFAILAIGVAATIKLRSKMREQQLHDVEDLEPFGDEVLPEDLVQPLAMMETNVELDRSENRVVRLEVDRDEVKKSITNDNAIPLSSVSFVSTQVPTAQSAPMLANSLFVDADYRIKKLDTAKATRDVVKKKVAAPKKKAATPKSTAKRKQAKRKK